MRGTKASVKARHNAILAYLSSHNKVTTKELARLHNVSEVTIRRDLDELSNNNLIVRTHGGVHISRAAARTFSYPEKEKAAKQSKQLIADRVAEMVPEGSTVFCNSGSTVFAILERLSRKNVTVITNNTHVFPIQPDAVYNLICTGGNYNHETESFVGSLATKIIEEATADLCIMGAGGVSADFGVSTNDLGQVAINAAMAANCKGQVILAVDGKKIGKKCYFRSLLPKQIDLIVTDTSADPYELDAMRVQGIKVILIDKDNEEMS